MNIGNILSSALSDSFRNKRLWQTSVACTLIIALILALTIGLYFALIALTFGLEDTRRATGDEPSIGITIALSIGVLFIYALIYIAIAVSQGALIDAVNQQDSLGAISVSRAMRSGMLRCIPLFIVGLIAFLPIIVLIVVFAVAMFAAASAGALDEEQLSNFAGVLTLPVFCIGLPLMLPSLGILVYAERDIVINEQGPLAALRTGWAKLRKHWGETLVFGALFYFVQLILNFAATILFYVVLFGAVGISALDGSTSSAAGASGVTLGIVAAALCGGLFTLVIGTVVYSWYNSLYALVWTRAFTQSGPPAAHPATVGPLI
jgi:MFS family permease